MQKKVLNDFHDSNTVIPFNPDAEMSVLGGMMLGERGTCPQVRETLATTDFYREANGIIFAAMCALDDKGCPVDIVTLKAELEKRGGLDSVGGVGYLMQLGECVPTTANILHHATLVKDDSRLRALLSCAGHISARCQTREGSSVGEIVADAERLIAQVAGDDGNTDPRRDWKDAPAVTKIFIDDLCERLKHGGRLAGISTGIALLDKYLNGLKAKKLYVIAAPPGAGKTAFITALFTNIARAGLKPAMFEFEMPTEEIGERIICNISGISNRAFQTAQVTRQQLDDLKSVRKEMSELTFHTCDYRGMTISEIRSKCRELSRRGELDILFVDYLQIIKPEPHLFRKDRREQVDHAIQSLKTIAGEFGIPVIVLSQLSREVNKREDKRPILSDLKETSGIESEADCVAFLYRPSYYAPPVSGNDPDAIIDDECEIIIAKHRGGATGKLVVGCQMACSRFYDLPANSHGEDSPF